MYNGHIDQLVLPHDQSGIYDLHLASSRFPWALHGLERSLANIDHVGEGSHVRSLCYMWPDHLWVLHRSHRLLQLSHWHQEVHKASLLCPTCMKPLDLTTSSTRVRVLGLISTVRCMRNYKNCLKIICLHTDNQNSGITEEDYKVVLGEVERSPANAGIWAVQINPQLYPILILTVA